MTPLRNNLLINAKGKAIQKQQSLFKAGWVAWALWELASASDPAAPDKVEVSILRFINAVVSNPIMGIKAIPMQITMWDASVGYCVKGLPDAFLPDSPFERWIGQRYLEFGNPKRQPKSEFDKILSVLRLLYWDNASRVPILHLSGAICGVFGTLRRASDKLKEWEDSPEALKSLRQLIEHWVPKDAMIGLLVPKKRGTGPGDISALFDYNKRGKELLNVLILVGCLGHRVLLL